MQHDILDPNLEQKKDISGKIDEVWKKSVA